MTNSPRTAWTTLRWLARALALAAAYFVVAKIGLRYATIGPSISPVWPPTGLAVAALVLLGPGYWPAILLGAFVANATTSIPLLAAAGIACGNAAEATVAAYVLRRVAGQHVTLDDLVGVRTLVGVAAPVGALASATVGVTTLWLAHVVPGAGVWSALSLWWAGDYLGALVVAPVFLTWLPDVRIGRRRHWSCLSWWVVPCSRPWRSSGASCRRRSCRRPSTPFSCSPSWLARRCGSAPGEARS